MRYQIPALLLVAAIGLVATVLGLAIDRLQDRSFDRACWDRSGYVIVGYDPHEDREVRYCTDSETRETVASR